MDDFEPQSSVSSLRVLAVRPEPASGAPGAEVTLKMSFTDASSATLPAGEGRPIEIVWLGGCHNPPSRQYYACQPLLRELASHLETAAVKTNTEGVPPGYFGVGEQFQFTLPDDILSSAPRVASDPVHFGVSYLFFAVCAGQVRPRPDFDDRVPLDCVDPVTGVALDSRDFVLGFTTLFTYEGVHNENPRLLGVDFDGVDVASGFAGDGVQVPCNVDEDCSAPLDPAGAPLDAAGAPFACAESRLCAPSVRRCAKGDCPAYRLWPRVDAASAETLPDAQHEIVWVNYYAAHGEVNSETQLVSDRKLGLLDGYQTSWKPPAEPGSTRLWVTLNDQRGGADWASFDVVVR